MPITCPNGHVNDAGNRFCDQCGAQLSAAPAAGVTETPAAALAPSAAPDTSASGGLACPTCGQENLPGTAFCENCGAQLPPPEPAQAPDADAAPAAAPAAGGTITCPNCGTENEPGNSFCEQCGASLAATAAPAAQATPAADESGVSAGVAGDEAALAAPGAQSQPATDEVQPPSETGTAGASQTALPPIPEASTEQAPQPEASTTPAQPEQAAPTPPEPPAQAAPAQAEPAPRADAAAAQPGAETCPNCGTQLPPNAKFCLECGTRIERQPELVRPTHCQNCGAELPPNAKFCLECGTKVDLIPAGTAKPGAPSAEATYQQQSAEGQDTGLPSAVDVAVARPDTAAAQPEAPAAGQPSSAGSGARTYDAEAGEPVATPPIQPVQAPPPTPAPPPVQPAPVVSSAPAVPPAAASQGGPRLIGSDGTTISLPPQSELVVGREDPVSGIHPDIDMTPHGGEAGGVSRRHALLRQQGGQWTVTDLDSTNYTRVDGSRIAPNTDVPLHDGARLQFGRVSFEFRSQ